MTIVVTGRDDQVTSRSKQHVEEKLQKLSKFFNGIQKVEAILGRSGQDAEVELVISVARVPPIVCRSHAKELYTALDLVLDKAETQLTKHKERLKAHRTQRPQEIDES